MLASRKDEFEQIKLLRDEIVTRNSRVSKPTSKTQTKDTKKEKKQEEKIPKIQKSNTKNIDDSEQKRDHINEAQGLVSTLDQENKDQRTLQAELELEEIFKRRKRKLSVASDSVELSETENDMSFQSKESHSIAVDNNKITIWDLPSGIKRMQVFETVRFLGRVELI